MTASAPTRLAFEAPRDLSIGTVRVENAGGTLYEWTATTENRTFTAESVEPGFYTAEISPAGVPSQSVVFEVKAGQANDILIPDFGALAVTGGGITFLDIADHKAALEALYGKVAMAAVQPPAAVEKAFAAAAPGARRAPSPAPAPAPAPVHKRISIGLSQEQGEPEAWQAFSGQARVELAGGKLDLIVDPLPSWKPASGERVRLSVAIERVRIERLLLPMYRGGVNIRFTPSPLSAKDINLQVLPADPRIRGLARVLVAGTQEDAVAVRDHLLDTSSPDVLMAKGAGDPWAAILSALLLIRFPGVLPELTEPMVALLAAAAPWAQDSHVIAARQRLYVRGTDEDSREVARAALEMLDAAQAQGAPYFAYSNQLFGELVAALHGFCSANAPELLDHVATINARRLRDGPLQSSAGVSFSWLRRDQAKLAEGIITPNCTPSGELSTDRTAILFNGRITGGQISFGGGETSAPKGESGEAHAPGMISFADAQPDCPAAHRPPGPANDPNDGRFGGLAQAGGFTLAAHFTELKGGRWVTIDLVVSAENEALVRPGDVAWFCLHPTFQPQWVKVVFCGSHATLSTQAWGGFTVGVWLPTQGVELENDLSKIPGAPRVIREL